MKYAAIVVRLAIVGVCVVVLGGCTTAPPRLQVVETRVAERTDDGVVIEFVVEGTNPNPEELPLQTVRYSMEIDGQRVFSGERSAETTLRRSGAQRFTLPASVAHGAGVRFDGVHAYRLSGEVMYIASDRFSELLFELGARRPRASFSQRGEIDLSGGR